MAAAALHLDTVAGETFADELKPGTRLLLGQFTIDSFLCAGGFGITYLARDSLDRRMVVKECFPSTVCRRDGTSVHARSNSRQDEFRSIVALFMQEAMNLSQLDHPNIVKVHQVFEDKGAAYMAMDWIDGPDLLATIEGTAPRLRPDQIVHALHRMLDALEHVHALGFLHRDISPDNILLDRGTGEPVLIDFGAARKDVTRKSRVLSGLRVVKDGYSPQEFYISGSKQAPCSDLYALAASFFHLVADEAPKTSQERLSTIANGTGDPQRPLAGRVTSYDPAFLAAIDMAMSISPATGSNRPRSGEDCFRFLAPHLGQARHGQTLRYQTLRDQMMWGRPVWCQTLSGRTALIRSGKCRSPTWTPLWKTGTRRQARYRIQGEWFPNGLHCHRFPQDDPQRQGFPSPPLCAV